MKKIIALLLALGLVLGLCACGEKPGEEKLLEVEPPAQEETDPQEPETPEETPEQPAEEQPEENPAEEPAKNPDENPDEELELGGIASSADGYWYEVDSGSGEYDDSVGNHESYSYAIPAFNVDSADASRLNGEIEQLCSEYVDEMQEGEESKTSLITTSVRYEASQTGNIVSILIIVDTNIDLTSYHPFNLDVSTGSEATGTDLAAAAGIDEDALIAAAQQAASDKFEELYGGMEKDDFYEEQYAKTMSADAFSLSMPMYLNGSGKLCFVARIYAMAGAEAYDYILEIA